LSDSLPYVSVIIPVYNDAARLRLCLAALAEQTYPHDRFEVIVVDNGSTAPPRALVESFPFCRYAEEAKPGSYAARNRGLALAQGEIIAFTDADCIPAADWLERIVSSFNNCQECDVIGGRILLFPADQNSPTAVELYDCIFNLIQKDNVEIGRHSATANMAARQTVFARVGTFDDALKSGGDVEWGNRAAAAGCTIVYADDALVRHPARSAWRDIITQARRHAGGRHQRASSQRSWAAPRRLVRSAWRRLVPSPANLVRVYRHPLVTNFSQWIKVVVVMFCVSYVHIFERLRLLTGAQAKRE
jgi:glycosyltransferase involved in cell wall biosynthesis